MSAALLLLPDFSLIALGALLRRLRNFDARFWAGVERLVYIVLFPALLFRSLATSTATPSEAWRLIVVGVTFTLAGMALALLARPLLRLSDDTFAGCFQCAFRFNTYVALAAASRIGGAPAVAMISLLIGILVPIVNVAAVAMLARRSEARVLTALARNPLVLACVAGIAYNVAGLPMPALPGRILELLSAAALPLGLLAVGAGLAFERGTLPWTAIACFNGIKLVALPAIAFWMARAMELDALAQRVAVTMAAVPTATSAYILAVQMLGKGAAVALLISTGTLMAVITLPLWLSI
ncbi:MAG TPA: AEC family transporter [Casimicrobiaceae bacterium]|nr:AEC family transporter [Casimicrobiaceae bacterium]